MKYKSISNIDFSLDDESKVHLTNKYGFMSLDEFDYEYAWLEMENCKVREGIAFGFGLFGYTLVFWFW